MKINMLIFISARCDAIPASLLLIHICHLAGVTTPCDSHALCLLGLAQLAQYNNNAHSEKSKEAVSDACLRLRAGIEPELKSPIGEPPEQLSSERTVYIY